MVRYRSLSGKDSGVTEYEIGDDFIRVKFHDSRIYNYTTLLNSKATIVQMKSLARASRGLSTYISRKRDELKFTEETNCEVSS